MLTFKGHLCMGSQHLKGKCTVMKRSFKAAVSSHSLLTTPFSHNSFFERYRLLIAFAIDININCFHSVYGVTSEIPSCLY